MPVCGGFELRVSLVIFQDKPALLDAMAEVQRGSTSSQTQKSPEQRWWDPRMPTLSLPWSSTVLPPHAL